VSKPPAKPPIEDEVINGLTVGQWNGKWSPVAGGFGNTKMTVSHKHGIWRAILRGETVYIGSGVQLRGQGIHDRIVQMLRGHITTGNRSDAARRLRQHQQELELSIIDLGRPADAVKYVNKLKARLIKLRDPEWNKELAIRLARRPKT
jgi:hypothetical protein